MSEVGDGERLQPNPAGAGEGGEENAVATKDHVANPGNSRDAEIHPGLEHTHVSGMDSDRFARREIVGDDFATELNKGFAVTCQFLQKKTVAAKNARA